MTTCILCASPLPPNTKPEHIWLAALGGRKETRRVLCNACNGVMGSGPDKTLAESVELIRNILNFRSGKGNPPPTIKGLRHGNRKVRLAPGGIPQLDGGRPFVITNHSDGTVSVDMTVASKEHLHRVLPDLADALRLDVSEVKTMLRTGCARFVAQRPETQHHCIELGGPEAMRSMLKTCLTLWADLHGAGELQKTIYDDARCFVRHGGDDLARAICQLDHAPLQHAEALPQQFGPHFNLAMVASDADGRVVGYFRLYDVCAWRFVLCPAGGPPSAVATYISNPQDPKVWTDENLVPPTGILDTSAKIDFKAAQAALTRLYGDYHAQATDAQIAKFGDKLRNHLEHLGDNPTRDQLEALASEMADSTTRWFFGLPDETLLSPEEIARLIDEEPTK